MAQPEVTVILPTYRRPVGLRRALDGLAGQADPGVTWEVVVVDNGGSASLESWGGESSFPASLRLVHEQRLGAGHARNRGIAEARGVVTAMLDDDVVPQSNWLASLIEPMLAGRCHGAGGTVLLDPAVSRPSWFDEEGIGGYLTRFTLGEHERPIAGNEIVVTANAAFQTDLLRATGGFHPDLGPRGRTPMVADDAFLTRRFRALGSVVHFVPNAVVVHELSPERLRARYLFRRAYAQGRSDWLLDRVILDERRLNGARVAVEWLVGQMARRWHEQLWRPHVAFHAACDVVRTAGSLREAAAWVLTPAPTGG
jgi:GT2 family glycosyltransferase